MISSDHAGVFKEMMVSDNFRFVLLLAEGEGVLTFVVDPSPLL